MSLNAAVTFVVTEQQATCRFQYASIMFCFATSPQVPLFPALRKQPPICVHLKVTASFIDLWAIWANPPFFFVEFSST